MQKNTIQVPPLAMPGGHADGVKFSDTFTYLLTYQSIKEHSATITSHLL